MQIFAVSAEFLCLLHYHFFGCAVFVADDVHAFLLEVYLPTVERMVAYNLESVVNLDVSGIEAAATYICDELWKGKVPDRTSIEAAVGQHRKILIILNHKMTQTFTT